MGCACKNKIDKTLKLVPEYTVKDAKKNKGLKHIFGKIVESIWYFFLRTILAIIVLIVLIPFVLFTVIKLAFNIEWSIKLPRNLLHKLKETEEKYG